MDVLDGIANISYQVGGALARKLDMQLRIGLERRLGHLPDLAELRGRLSAVTFSADKDKATTYCLDGEPFLKVWPAEVAMTGNLLTANQRFLPIT